MTTTAITPYTKNSVVFQRAGFVDGALPTAVDVGVCNVSAVIPLSLHAPEEVSMCGLSGLMALRWRNGSIQDSFPSQIMSQWVKKWGDIATLH